MAEFTSIAGAMVALGRGTNLPYFGKQTNIWPYSPREQKRKAIRGFPGVSDMAKMGKGTQFGLIEDEDSGNEGVWDCVSTLHSRKVSEEREKTVL